jgi:hypothetical protein
MKRFAHRIFCPDLATFKTSGNTGNTELYTPALFPRPKDSF